jgi:hypothetical protein
MVPMDSGSVFYGIELNVVNQTILGKLKIMVHI